MLSRKQVNKTEMARIVTIRLVMCLAESQFRGITVTRHEILHSLNKAEDFILAIVEFLDNGAHRTHYIRQPFQREPDFGVTSVNYEFADLLTRAGMPR